MISRFVEVTNRDDGGINWGKFAVMRFEPAEWERKSQVGGGALIGGRGWTRDHGLVLDLQTGEGAIFLPGGSARADLNKHKIWVCPLFEPFLKWLYKQDLSSLDALPNLVSCTEKDAPSSMVGYRHPGPEE